MKIDAVGKIFIIFGLLTLAMIKGVSYKTSNKGGDEKSTFASPTHSATKSVVITLPITREWSSKFVFADDSRIMRIYKNGGAEIGIGVVDPNIGFFVAYNDEKKPEYIPPRRDWKRLGHRPNPDRIIYSARWVLEEGSVLDKSEIEISVYPSNR